MEGPVIDLHRSVLSFGTVDTAQHRTTRLGDGQQNIGITRGESICLDVFGYVSISREHVGQIHLTHFSSLLSCVTRHQDLCFLL